MTKKEIETLERLKAKEKEEQAEERKKQRDFAKRCEKEFGKKPSEIKAILSQKNADDLGQKHDQKYVDFANEICNFYDINFTTDMARWKNVMLNDKSKKYWADNRSTIRTQLNPQTVTQG